jgi:hypothetical protein
LTGARIRNGIELFSKKGTILIAESETSVVRKVNVNEKATNLVEVLERDILIDEFVFDKKG